MLSMLGNAKGEAPGGFLLLDEDDVKGQWEKDATGMNFNTISGINRAPG